MKDTHLAQFLTTVIIKSDMMKHVKFFLLLFGGCFSLRHPLDPLSPEEIHTTAVVIRGYDNSANWIYNRIVLQEPDKNLLLESYLRNTLPQNVPRKAFAVILNSATMAGIEVIVNLDERRVESWTNLPPDLQPAVDRQEYSSPIDIAKRDVKIQERCRALGWSNMSLVAVDVWPAGYVGDRPEVSRLNRLVTTWFFGKMFAEDNEYAHPFDFNAIVDLKQQKVVVIDDLPTRDTCYPPNPSGCSGTNYVPRRLANYDPDLLGGDSYVRQDLIPVNISQPGGSSSKVSDYLWQWQKWQLRLGYDVREGVILHHIGYHDNDVGASTKSRYRPLFYRLSFSETFTPYGDPRRPFQRKAPYDIGELDIGLVPNLLDKRYCNGQNVRYFDAHVVDPYGEPRTLKRAFCVYEEDVGILWKHTDYRTGKSTVVRNQRLNIGFMATTGNYDYICKWRFYQDASIQYEIRMTGIVSTNLVAKGSTPGPHGTLVAPQVDAQYHQHIFVARIDPEIDGNRNTVAQTDVMPTPSKYGQGFTTKLTPFRDSQEARSYANTKTSRSWLMMSSGSGNLNPYTKTQTSYKLTPLNCPRFNIQKDSPLYPTGEFSEYDLWVTPYKDGQMYAGDRYLNESGIPYWSRQASEEGNTIYEADVVVWHLFRMNHIPRVEDFPVMPTEVAGFTLKPYNFFKQNPALDVPAPRPVRRGPNRKKDGK